MFLFSLLLKLIRRLMSLRAYLLKTSCASLYSVDRLG